MTPEQQESLRELYRKNFLALVLLPPEVVEEELRELTPKQIPDQVQNVRRASLD